jgi:type IV secretion system protein VirB10
MSILGTLILALLMQGPRNLQIDADKAVTPPHVVPAGTTIPVAIINRISTKNAKDGDGVYVRTTFPITVDNQIVIPEGSHIRGKISEVQRPGRVKGKAALSLTFQTLILPTGLTIPLYASLGGASGVGKRDGETTIEGDSSKGADAGKIGTGATVGSVPGAISHGAKGAAVGAAGGAAVGLAAVLLTRGQDLILEPGATLDIVLDRPLEP